MKVSSSSKVAHLAIYFFFEQKELLRIDVNKFRKLSIFSRAAQSAKIMIPSTSEILLLNISFVCECWKSTCEYYEKF